MSKQPWMKFYPADWRADPALRTCSLAARGLWMEMLAIMHEASPRGHLVVNGSAVTGKQLSSLSGGAENEVAGFLLELERAGVFSRKKNGVIFSRRMERDENHSRKMRENGKMGGNPTLCKTSQNEGLDNPEDNTQKLEARCQRDSDPVGSGAEAPPDIRKELFDAGLKSLVRQTGKPESRCRPLIGKWLKASRDDCRLVLSKIRQAEADRVADPVPWIGEAIKPAWSTDPVERQMHQSF